MISIGEKLEKHQGLGQGFDLLRIVLALGIVGWHSFAIAREGVWLEQTWLVWFLGYGMLYMFFALSGFLIAGSALRLRLKDFLVNRGLRILPALAVEVVLSAFILGPWLTSLSARQYFSKGATYHYLTNIIGMVNFQLPGVFQANPVDAVNYSLWTVPYEFVCYGIMSIFIVFGLLKKPWPILSGAAAVCFIGLVCILFGLKPEGHESFAGLSSVPSKIIYFFFTDRGSRLLVAFMLGIVIYLWRYRIPYSHLLFAISLIYCLGVATCGPANWMSYPALNVLLAIPMTYITIYLGVSKLPTPALLHHQDYSYGIYLYAMPIQQTMIDLFPSVRSALLQLVLAIPAITLFAAFSWHFIERPILKLRRHFSFVARQRGVNEEDLNVTASTAKGAKAG